MKVGGLRRLPSLSSLDETFIFALASKMRTRVILASEPRIVGYGELVSELILVTRGSVEVSAGVTRGRCSLLRSDWRGPGSVICEAAVFTPSRSGVEIRADFAEVRPTEHNNNNNNNSSSSNNNNTCRCAR